MTCQECGAGPPGAETCRDRFHAVLAAEAGNDELLRMHGLAVLTYHLQHPSLTKPWYQASGAEVMRRVFGWGEHWLDVLLEAHPRGVGRRQSEAAVKRLKAGTGPTTAVWAITRPIRGREDRTHPLLKGLDESAAILLSQVARSQRGLEIEAHQVARGKPPRVVTRFMDSV